MKVNYSETRTLGTVATWQRCVVSSTQSESAGEDKDDSLKALTPEQSAELDRLVAACGILQCTDTVLPDDAVLEGVHWTMIAEDDKGSHKIIGKCARNPDLPLEDTDPTEDEPGHENPVNYEQLGKLIEFLQPFLKSGFAPGS